MKYEVKNRVAIFQQDAILGLSPDQAHQRVSQLESLGAGRYRVIGQNVKFRFREVVEIIDGPAANTAMKEKALELGIRFGRGIGAKTLEARMAEVKAASEEYSQAAAATKAVGKAATTAARAKAAKIRKRR